MWLWSQAKLDSNSALSHSSCGTWGQSYSLSGLSFLICKAEIKGGYCEETMSSWMNVFRIEFGTRLLFVLARTIGCYNW
jgi:hypothetical protein